LYGVTLTFGKNGPADSNGTCVTVSFPSNFIKASGLPFKLPECELKAAQCLLYGVTLTFGKNGPADRNGTCVTVSYDSDEYNARWAAFT